VGRQGPVRPPAGVPKHICGNICVAVLYSLWANPEDGTQCSDRSWFAPSEMRRPIWYSPITQRNFPVDGNIKSRHWANIVLKQAGIEKKF